MIRIQAYYRGMQSIQFQTLNCLIQNTPSKCDSDRLTQNDLRAKVTHTLTQVKLSFVRYYWCSTAQLMPGERERERERETIHDLELGILSSVSAMKTKEHEQDVPRGWCPSWRRVPRSGSSWGPLGCSGTPWTPPTWLAGRLRREAGAGRRRRRRARPRAAGVRGPWRKKTG